MAVLVYHWKHGWIPLTHAAALSKAHGNSKLADRYVPGASRHHVSRDTHGKSAREVHGQLEAHAHITARPSAYQGSPGHHITGTDTRGRRVDVFVPGDRAAAQRAIDNIHAGKPAFGTPAGSVISKAPETPADAFRMSGPELRQHAANGSRVAHAELARRADRKTARHPTAPPRSTAPPKPSEPAAKPPATPATPPTSAAAVDKKTALEARWNAENQQIAPTGHTIQSKTIGTTDAGTPQGFHSQYAENGERAGSVIEQRDGNGYRAMFEGKPVGIFSNRKDAHAAVADKYRLTKEAEAKKLAQGKASRERKSEQAAKGLDAWQPHTLQSDGTRAGDAAAAKIKQSFKSGNHTVHIETTMTKEQTHALLSDVHSVLLKSGLHDHPEGITFHVPSGDAKFRTRRNGTITGGYVRHGQRTVFLNPKVANGQAADTFGGPGAGESLMPIAKETGGRQYVITHELGHIVDNEHQHTTQRFERTPSGLQIPAETPSQARTLAREHVSHLSRYGRTNTHEAYAEAYAQWIHGGPGSSPAADAYAASFGWVVPKWYRDGGRRR